MPIYYHSLKKILRSLVLGLAFMANAEANDTRNWTSTDGRVLEGSFVKADTETVSVRRPDGRVAAIPLKLLNEDDRKFAAEKAAEQSAAAEKAELEKSGLGQVKYSLSGGSENWDPARKKRIVDAMDAAVAFYNKHARFKKSITANNSPGTPTADANYDGWINWGGSISRRVALHEISHTLGIGTHENWQKNITDGKWTGKHALALIREFDGSNATLSADRMHFWPYGLNQDNESSKENDVRHVKMVEAMRKDMGIR